MKNSDPNGSGPTQIHFFDETPSTTLNLSLTLDKKDPPATGKPRLFQKTQPVRPVPIISTLRIHSQVNQFRSLAGAKPLTLNAPSNRQPTPITQAMKDQIIEEILQKGYDAAIDEHHQKLFPKELITRWIVEKRASIKQRKL